MRIGIVKFSTSNLFSVKSACEYFKLNTIISNDLNELKNMDALILPGVGSFKEAMSFLKKNNLVELILNFVEKKKKIMGICLGYQLLFSKSNEFGICDGLNVIKGDVKKISDKLYNNSKKIHTGWNKILLKKKSNIIQEEDSRNFFYFTHSFYAEPEQKKSILTTTFFNNYEFCSSIELENIFGCQFHPEKSGETGIKMYYNFFKK
tara:strand:+ start:45843 stop:46460 length:618 start_codon:yes stop_codon:yes gene_type:complete